MKESTIMIKSFWYTGDGNNFGDILGPTIVHQLTQEKVSPSLDKGSLVTIGSIVNLNYPNNVKFWGSGIISKDVELFSPERHEYLAVRGPKTRKRLLDTGIDCPEIYGDPALLLPLMFSKKQFETEKTSKIGLLPHWVDANIFLRQQKNFPESKFIDIRSNADSIIKEVVNSDIVITSTLHGLILCESYDVPCVYVKVGEKVMGGTFKYEDYFNSTNRDLYYLDYTNKEMNLKEILDYQKTIPKMDINLVPLLNAFPHKINNNKILDYVEKKSL